jgi:hypothetical protein
MQRKALEAKLADAQQRREADAQQRREADAERTRAEARAEARGSPEGAEAPGPVSGRAPAESSDPRARDASAEASPTGTPPAADASVLQQRLDAATAAAKAQEDELALVLAALDEKESQNKNLVEAVDVQTKKKEVAKREYAKQKDRAETYKEMAATYKAQLRSMKDTAAAHQAKAAELERRAAAEGGGEANATRTASDPADGFATRAEQFAKSLEQYKAYLVKKQGEAAGCLDASVAAAEAAHAALVRAKPKAGAKLLDKLNKLRSQVGAQHKENVASVEQMLEYATSHHKALGDQLSTGEAEIAKWLDSAAEKFLAELGKQRKKTEASQAKLVKKIAEAGK